MLLVVLEGRASNRALVMPFQLNGAIESQLIDIFESELLPRFISVESVCVASAPMMNCVPNTRSPQGTGHPM